MTYELKLIFWKLDFMHLFSPLPSPSDGHNEAEFGMSWCAGFGGSFYNAYFQVIKKKEKCWPYNVYNIDYS